MTVIVDFALPPDSFALGRALEVDPHMHVELERIVPSGERMFPYFWAWNDEFDSFERAARSEPAIARLTVVEEMDHARLYRAEWNDVVAEVMTGMNEAGAAVLDAVGTVDGWRFQLRFDDRPDLRRFREYCTEHGIPIDVLRLIEMDVVDVKQWHGLTEKQHEILKTALERGYFDDPRTENLEGLSEELDISARAASRLLNRGLRVLLEGTIGPGSPYADERGEDEKEQSDDDVSLGEIA